jgi:hypothetical protein
MDQDRWTSFSLVSAMVGKKNAAAPKPASPESVANDRYRSDVEQAAAMRRGMEKRRQLESSKNSNEISEADVLLGLRGLDEADSLRERGDLQRALKISEMSLELLIEFLKSDPLLVPTIGRDTVGARLHVALSDAENMKRLLKQQAQPSKTQDSPPKASSPSAFQSLSAALGGAVRRVSSPKPKAPSLSKQQTAGQSTSSAVAVVSRQPSNRNVSKLAVQRPAIQVPQYPINNHLASKHLPVHLQIVLLANPPLLPTNNYRNHHHFTIATIHLYKPSNLISTSIHHSYKKHPGMTLPAWRLPNNPFKRLLFCP